MISYFHICRSFAQNRIPCWWTSVHRHCYTTTRQYEEERRKAGQEIYHATLEPWHRKPYDEQLKIKQYLTQKAFKKFSNLCLHHRGQPTQAMTDQIQRLDGYACWADPVRPSPVLDSYRNKDRFCVGMDWHGQDPSVGFLIYDNVGKRLVVHSGLMRSQRETHHEISKLYEVFLRGHSLPACHHSLRSGHWRELLVRSNMAGEILVSVCFHPQEQSQEIIDNAKEDVYSYFMKECVGKFNIKSLQFQTCHRIRTSHEDGPFHVLHGSPQLEETICGYRFRLSPDAFMQLNTSAAEVLYDTVREYGRLSRNTTLLDFCSGIGSIGIVLSRHVKRVVGIEVIKHAVEDAQYNAKINGVDNADFHHGFVEKEIGELISKLDSSEDIVAVLNPGRGGLGAKVSRAIRRCAAIKRVIYVSCKPLGRACHNFAELCQAEDNDRYPGSPFLPTRAVTVDMFPHTRHLDLLVVFER